MKLEYTIATWLIDSLIKINFPFVWNPYELSIMDIFDIVDWITLIKHKKVIHGKNRKYSSFTHLSPRFTDDNPWNAMVMVILYLYGNKYIFF